MKRFGKKQTGVLSASDLKGFRGQTIYWIFFAVLSVAAIVSLLPAIWTILTAFKDAQEIYESFSFFPKNITWESAVTKVSEAWGFLQLGKPFVNTIVLSSGTLVFRVIISGFGGYALSKIKPKGTKLIFTLVVWTMMMPSQIRLVPNYMSYLHFPFAFDFGVGVNLLDTFWPMWLSAADCFAVLLFKNAFDGISTALVEAARLDGCNEYGVFFKIMLPLAMPVIMYESIVTLSAVWSDFFMPLLVLDKKSVVPLEVYRMQANPNAKMDTIFMGLVFASIPSFIIYVFFHKHIMGGINVGGVKG